MKIIKEIEIGLTSHCNLTCPLCTRNKNIFKILPKFRPKNLEINRLKEFINFINPEEVKLVGAVGEPTLYPYFYELLKFLKTNNIKIWLSTNGVTHNIKWWNKIKEVIPKNSIINIDLDHTDEDMQLYRRGTNLKKLKDHLEILAKYQNKDYILKAQRINFDWNKNNYNFFMEEVLNWGFDEVYNIPCYDFNPNEFKEDLSFWKHEKQDKYKLLKRINTLNSKKQNLCIKCESKKDKLIYLNYLGEVIPCCYINDIILKEETLIGNIYDDNFNDLIKNYFKIIDNPIESKYKETCIKFCTKINRQVYKEFNLDP